MLLLELEMDWFPIGESDFGVGESNSLWEKKLTLELEKATVYEKKNEYEYSDGSDEKDDKIFVAFEIDSVPQRRPFLLSRDMVYAKPSDKEVEAFQVSLFFN